MEDSAPESLTDMYKMKNNIFITGCSTGIGKELALHHLNRGDNVFGVSRNIGGEFSGYENFTHISRDLSDTVGFKKYISNFFEGAECYDFSRIYLNAGLIDNIYGMEMISLEKFNYILSVNLTINKVIMDFFICHERIKIHEVVVSSSIAGVRPREGMSAYAVSKAALNMMMKIYAIENPEIFIVSVGLCIFDSAVSGVVTAENKKLADFKELQELASRLTKPGYKVTAYQRAQDLLYILNNLMNLKVTSGDFFEIRGLL